MPSGKNGRCRKPIARSVKAIAPLSCTPSFAARVTYEPKPAPLNNTPAFAREKNAAVRAFCTDTSKPNTGASKVRKTPSTTPFASTTAIVTRALLPSGCRIAARVMFACCAPCEMIVFTSDAVSEFAVTVGLAMKGKKRVSTSPAMPPTTMAVNCEGCALRIGNSGSTAPGKLPTATVGGAGALSHSDKRAEFRQPECCRRELKVALQNRAHPKPRSLLQTADRNPSGRDRLCKRHRLQCRLRQPLLHPCKSERCPDRRSGRAAVRES